MSYFARVSDVTSAQTAAAALEEERQRLAKDVAAFRAAGGHIERIPFGHTRWSESEECRRRAASQKRATKAPKTHRQRRSPNQKALTIRHA